MALKIPREIYRYRPLGLETIDGEETDFSKREIRALQNSEIWFSKFTDLNDPFEMSSFEFVGDTDSLAENVASFIGGAHTAELKRYYKANKDIASKGWLNKETSGTASFSETWNNQVMWASYCRSYNGFVVVYDTEYLLATCVKQSQPVHETAWGSRFHGVFYKDQRQHGLHDIVTHNSQDNPSPHNTKHTDWSYEKEWRLIFKDAYGLAQHGPPAIQGIIIGMNTSTQDVKSLKFVCQKNGWSLEILKQDQLSFSRIQLLQKMKRISNPVLGERVENELAQTTTSTHKQELFKKAIELAKTIPNCIEVHSFIQDKIIDGDLRAICTLKHANGLENVVIVTLNPNTNSVSLDG